jgi:aspartate kinase
VSKYVVAKYGGTSMAEPQIVADIISSHPEQIIIVCSAPGKSGKHDHKVTDHLLNLAAKPDNLAEINNVVKRFEEVTEGLSSEFIDKFINDLRKDLAEGKDTDFIISRGEYYSALALAERIGAEFIDAAEIFHFNSEGKLDREKTSGNIASKLATNKRIVVPGFYGVNSDGKICLFKRGGSDRTGAVIAASLNMDYENWTDIDGIMNANPNIISEARLIKELTYEEVREGAHGGTGTLMGDSILDLEYGDFCTTLKNTFNPKGDGTTIKRTRQTIEKSPVVAISARNDLLGLTVHDMGMRDRKGYLVKVLEILADNKISIEHMPAAQDAITITFHKYQNIDIQKINQEVSKILVSPSASCSISPCGVAYLVGEKLRNLKDQHNIMISALKALEGENVPVLSVMMHPDSPSVALILKHDQIIDAQKILYQKFLA